MSRALRPPMTGIGRYTLNLLQHIGGSLSPDSMVVFALRGQTPADGVRAQRVVSPIPSGHELPRLFWEQALVPFDVRRLGVDVYHSPNHVFPLAMRCKSVVTVHAPRFSGQPPLQHAPIPVPEHAYAALDPQGGPD